MRAFLFGLMVAGLVACGGDGPTPVTTVKAPPPSFVGGNPKYFDADPVDWTGRRPWSYPVHGVDVSRWQAGLDWDRLARHRVAFGFIKATEGGDHSDPEFRTHWQRAKAAGIPRGAYHFYYFCRPAHEQANWFIRNVPKEPDALPPVLDVEWNHASRTCRLRPEPEVVRESMNTWLRDVTRHYGKRPIIYTTPDFYHENELWKITGHAFWLRAVAEHPSQVYPGQGWTFWQYTGTGRVPGAPGNIDLNVFSGSAESFATWLAVN